MSDAILTRDGSAAVVTLHGGKVNALTESTVAQLRAHLATTAADDAISSLVLTGAGQAFFSFGFDIPHFMNFSADQFAAFLHEFTTAYRELYTFPKPVVAALNGHTIAGGAMLAGACDRRVMADGRARISLNEVTFGASVFAGSVETLRALVGERAAEEILLGGGMYDATRARDLGWVDVVAPSEEVLPQALRVAGTLAPSNAAAYGSIKRLLRGERARRMEAAEPASIAEFVEIWYSDAMRERLGGIEIRR